MAVTRAPAYLSKAWIDAARERVVGVGDLPALVGDVTLSLLLVVTDRPGLDGEAVFIRFDRGRLRQVQVGQRHGMEARHGDADFIVWATYATFSEIHEGRLTEKVAVLSGRIRLRGSMLQALRLLRTVERLNGILRQEPATY